MNPYVLVFWLLLPMLCLAAWRWGERPERHVAAMYLIAALATLAVRTSWSSRYHSVELGVSLVDAALLIALAREAAFSHRWWPLWSTALQAVATLSHLGKALNPKLMPLGYSIMTGASSYPMLLILAGAIVASARRRARLRSSISRGSSIATPPSPPMGSPPG